MGWQREGGEFYFKSSYYRYRYRGERRASKCPGRCHFVALQVSLQAVLDQLSEEVVQGLEDRLIDNNQHATAIGLIKSERNFILSAVSENPSLASLAKSSNLYLRLLRRSVDVGANVAKLVSVWARSSRSCVGHETTQPWGFSYNKPSRVVQQSYKKETSYSASTQRSPSAN